MSKDESHQSLLNFRECLVPEVFGLKHGLVACRTFCFLTLSKTKWPINPAISFAPHTGPVLAVPKMHKNANSAKTHSHLLAAFGLRLGGWSFRGYQPKSASQEQCGCQDPSGR